MSALSHALTLVRQALAKQSAGASFTELIEGTTIPRASAHRIAKELVELGLLEFDAEQKRYRGGMMLATFGFQVIAHYDVRKSSRPAMQMLHDRLGQTVTLGIRDGTTGVYLDKIEDEQLKLRLHSEIGKTFPLHCTAMGKVMLALGEESSRNRVLASGLEGFTPNTITHAGRLQSELSEIAQQGFAIDNEEITRGFICLAAPIFAFDGNLSGAMSFTCEKHLFEELTIERIRDEVLEAARMASGGATTAA